MLKQKEIERVVSDYDTRHGIESAPILTVTDDEQADLISGYLSERVSGKVVVEIGGGIGLLALHLSSEAKHVYVIEANPAWSMTYLDFFYKVKPANVTWIFGAASEMYGQLRADVALFCTHSDASGMRAIASKFAPEVIDVYGEVISQMEQKNPLAEFRDLKKGEEVLAPC